MITVEEVVQGLVSQGFKEVGGSDVFRILIHPIKHNEVKVFYRDYELKTSIIVRESVEEYYYE